VPTCCLLLQLVFTNPVTNWLAHNLVADHFADWLANHVFAD
jgi:hypothetical protein